MSSPSALESLLRRRMVITCGTGGVGKTTVSAALAVQAALHGKRAVVITIDPAKRLATSLGLGQLGSEPADLTARLSQAIGGPVSGSFHAVIPDSRQTYERFIRGLTKSEATVQRIFRNPILDTFSREFSGANEYLALEELHHMAELERFDFIVLDTPPSRNTLSFLEAPQLLARLFEEKLLKWLVLPTNKILAAGIRKTFGVLEKLTGAGFMNSLFDFGQALFEVQDNFLKKLKAIHRLLQSGEVGFILVCAPTPESAPELGHFLKQIALKGFHFDGVVLNRSLSAIPAGAVEPAPSLAPGLAVLEGLQAREKVARETIDQTAPKTGGNSLFYLNLPELARDVHSVEDLYHVATAMASPRD